jgi:hypothetical protein
LTIEIRARSPAGMPAHVIFVAQLAWFTLAFGVVARYVVWPWSVGLRPLSAASVWIAPQMSRVLGLGLLVPNLSPGMPAEFSIPTAIGDSTTAVLALASFVALQRGHRFGLFLGWACMIVGIADGLHAMASAARLGVADHLAAQWFVPAINMPLMTVCHVAGVLMLLRIRRAGPAASAG